MDRDLSSGAVSAQSSDDSVLDVVLDGATAASDALDRERVLTLVLAGTETRYPRIRGRWGEPEVELLIQPQWLRAFLALPPLTIGWSALRKAQREIDRSRREVEEAHRPVVVSVIDETREMKQWSGGLVDEVAARGSWWSASPA